METVHLGISPTCTPRESEAISGSVMMVKGGRTSTVADGVVQPSIGIKAIPVLLVAKLVMYVINWVYSILLLRSRQQSSWDKVGGTYTKPIIQASRLQSVEIEGGSIKLGRNTGEGRAQISSVEISD